MIEFYRVLLTGFLIYLGFCICQSSEFVLETTNVQEGETLKIRYAGSAYDLKPEFFF